MTPENGMILKVADLFTEVCVELTGINSSERRLLEEFQRLVR